MIGHEITHGFDNQGSQFDKDGNAENWWDDITKEKYDLKTQCVVDQYSAFYLPSVDMYVNGELTQGENIADTSGQSSQTFASTPTLISLIAYKILILVRIARGVQSVSTLRRRLGTRGGKASRTRISHP